MNRRITKPPGGDTNEIFTTPNSTPPSTPRKVKNYMASNIFTPESAGPVGNVAVEPRSVRHRPDDDSFGRLFGAQGKGDVTDSPRVKNLQKSSIIFADAGVKNGSANGHTNGTNGTNGHGPSNGHNGATNGHGASNGSSNGHGHENGSGSSTPNGHSNGHGVTNGGSNGVTNGDSPAKTNGTNGTNGVNGTNGSHAETNGSNGVSNGKRIPPGGFSSKLW